jgi:hypothetical protein
MTGVTNQTMTQRTPRASRVGYLCSLLVSALMFLGGSGAARAATDQDPLVGAPPSEPPDTAAVPAPPSPVPTSGPGPVERLPSSAYPETTSRGLYGGSLWSTFHGLQWPFYPRTGIGLSGYGWLDSGYEKINVGDPAQQRYTKEYLQQGRFLLRVTPTYSNERWFVQAQAELVANKDQTLAQPSVADTDDLWIRAGQWKKWDVTVGRFEAFEVYHLGMGLDLNTEERRGAFDATNSPPDFYGATFLFYRPGSPGNIALHLYPFRSLRFELLAQGGSFGGLNGIGGRPAVIFEQGVFRLKAAGEYQLLTARTPGDRTERRNRGVAATAQVVLDPNIELGANVGYAIIDLSDPNGVPNTGLSGNQLSFGGFVNGRVLPDTLVGLGANYVTFENLHLNSQTGANDRSTNLQTFAAVQYLVGKQLFLKLVGAYAKSHFEKSFSNMAPYADTMYSVRLRVMYLF